MSLPLLQRKKYTWTFFIALAISLQLAFSVFAGITEEPSAASEFDSMLSEMSIPYNDYRAKYEDAKYASTEVNINGSSAQSRESVLTEAIGSYEGRSNAMLIKQGGWAEWDVNIEEEGLYTIRFTYYPVPGKGMDFELAFEIDGAKPFDEAGRVSVPRIWADEGSIEQDNQGNDIRPRQVERPEWLEGGMRDKNAYRDEDFSIYFTKGNHTIKLESLREDIAISDLRLCNQKSLPVYSEVFKEYQEVPLASDIFIMHQAEDTYRKSSPVIYPLFDRSSPATVPNDPLHIKLNTLGGNNWKLPGQWVSWEVDIPRDGLYAISAKYRQNIIRGLDVKRRVYIDGKIPFAEMACVKFPFTQNWAMNTFKTPEGQPYLFYLSKGKHQIKMEVILGEIEQILQTIENSVLEMNALYRRIVMLTGINPDPYRDYYLERDIPDLIARFTNIRNTLAVEAKKLDHISGTLGSETSLMYDVSREINSFLKQPETIPQRLDRYKANTGSLAELILRLREQPLELDYITVSSPDYKLPKADTGFIKKIGFRFSSFVASFFKDYSALGNLYHGQQNKPLKIWVSANDLAATGVSSGRDQAQVLKTLIDDEFVPKTGIPVNLTLVNTSDTLMQAIMGGNGPDIALFVPEAMPVNLAMRGALADLASMPDFDKLENRFHPSAFVSYAYNGGIYALPETQVFNMLFYRKDIFREFGLKPPETWNDFYVATAKLQKNNMQVGIPENTMVFEMLLMQNGGSIYSQDEAAVTLTTGTAINAFKDWTELYMQYSLPLAFDFFNRFRTGEMPMGITSYTFYNQLSVAAPEIRNLWGMMPVPGIKGEDGKINRSQSCNGTGSILIKNSRNTVNGYKFLDWWTSHEVQTEFGTELETVLGSSARYNTANLKAFERLPWSREEMVVIETQWKDIWDIPQTPASYYIGRNLTNAFRAVVFRNENPREVMNRYSKDMDKELKRKRLEFGLR